MDTHFKEFQQDPLAEMLQQFPLEQPSSDFTKKVMMRIPSMETESKVYFYQRPFFIALASIGFAACLLLFYYADFSFSVLFKQMKNYYTFLQNYIVSLHFLPQQTTFSPLIVAPLLLLFCIFVADRIVGTYKKRKQHQIFCI